MGKVSENSLGNCWPMGRVNSFDNSNIRSTLIYNILILKNLSLTIYHSSFKCNSGYLFLIDKKRKVLTEWAPAGDFTFSPLL